MQRFLWVGFAGALGTWARYLISLWAGKILGTAFPYGTLIVNVVGCFLIAAIMDAALSRGVISETVRLALTTGFLGGLTTYSSFNYDTTKLLGGSSWTTGALYFGLTTATCFAAGLCGLALSRRLLA